jgi:hypothetical protein
MYTACLQNWVRLRGNATSTLVQSEAEWVDLGAFQGVMPYVQVSGFGGSPTIALETSPTRDNVLFRTLGGTPGISPLASYTISAAGLQTPLMFTFADAAVTTPPGKWLRWKVTGTGNWSVVFRVWLSLQQARGAALRCAIPPLPQPAHAHPQDQTLQMQSRFGPNALYDDGDEPPDVDDEPVWPAGRPPHVDVGSLQIAATRTIVLPRHTRARPTPGAERPWRPEVITGRALRGPS